MKKLWLLLALFLPALLFLMGVNYFLDPANIFHSDGKQIAQALMQGNEVYIGSGNTDERQIKKNMISLMPKEVDLVVVGPSLAMTIDRVTVGTENMYNLALSGADYYDILAQLGMLEEQQVKPKKILFCVDSTFFDEALYGQMSRSETLKPYADYMLQVISNQDAKKPSGTDWKNAKVLVQQIFSVTYFQACVDYVKSNGLSSLQNMRWSIREDDLSENAYLRGDGSWVYNRAYQSATGETVQKNAQEYNIDYYFTKDGHVSESSKETFEQLIRYYQGQGVEVSLFLCPLSPSLYTRVENQKESHMLLWELEEFACRMAENYDLELYGSYDPKQMGVTDADYYDARHVRHEVLCTFFDWKTY